MPRICCSNPCGSDDRCLGKGHGRPRHSCAVCPLPGSTLRTQCHERGGTRTRGTPHRFISFIRKRLAACAFLRFCIRISSTSPLESTARQSQCFCPRINMTTSSRCHLPAGVGRSRRILAAICVPNRWHHIRMLSYETITPRSANISSISRRLGARHLSRLFSD